MLNESNLPKYFWADAVNTACYVTNRVLIRQKIKKTPYELYKRRKPNIAHLDVFGCKCFILNNGRDNLGKFDAKADEGIFLGYALSSKSFRVFNKRTMIVEESIHVTFDKTNPQKDGKDIIDDFVDIPHNSYGVQQSDDDEVPNQESRTEETNQGLPKEWKFAKNHPINNIIGDISKGVTTRSSLIELCNCMSFVSQFEPKSIDDAILDEHWLIVMNEELNQFTRNQVWELVPRPNDKQII